MKQYPEIQNSTGKDFREFDAYVFDKIDGSNLRFEWSRKRGWYKFGTRHRLFDQTDETFGCAIELFHTQLSENIKIVMDSFGKNKIGNVIVFCEFFGKNSFAGKHDPTDKKYLYLFDVAIDKKGLLGPKMFLKLFSDCQTPKFLGKRKWNKQFITDVRGNKISGVTFEGVVGKSGEGHNLIMSKAKTQVWIDKVKSLYATNIADKIINS